MLICYIAASFTVLLPEPKHERTVAKQKRAKQDACAPAKADDGRG